MTTNNNTVVEKIGSTYPREIVGQLKTIASTPEEVAKLGLVRKQYRVIVYFPDTTGNAKEQHFKNVEKTLPIDNENKRVLFYKIDIVPTDHKDKNGNKLIKVTSVFLLLDNQILILPIVWGLSAIGSLTAGYFFVDKVQEYQKTTGGEITTLALTALGIFLLWPKHKKG